MNTQEFGERLRELRKQAGLTQRELADKAEIGFTYLSKIESGVMPPPSEKVILRLAEALNADKDELMTLAGKIPADVAQMLKNPRTLQFLRSERAQKKIRNTNRNGGISLMKNLVNKRFPKVAIALALTLAVVASLLFAVPAKALTISFLVQPPSVTLGSTYSFTVKVDVEDTDLLPINHVDFEIYNVTNPTYKVSCTNLPIPSGPNQTASRNYTSADGAVSVIGTTGDAWGYGSGSRYGYGYGYQTETWGTQNLGTGTTSGYGYGYSPYIGPTSITYNVTWTVPSGWLTGTYEILFLVYGNGGVAFTTPTPPTFTVYAYVPPPPPPPPEPGVTDVSDIVDEEGVFTEDVTAESEDGNVSVTIDEGITGLTAEGEPISEISIIPMEELPAPPADASVVGVTYEVGERGMTFDSPITLCFTYDPDVIPEGINEEDLVIAMWDEETGQWLELEGCTVNTETHTICVQVDHFTPFTIIARAALPPTPPIWSVSDLSVQPAEVKLNQTVTITVSVANTGGAEGSYTVVLKINEVKEAEKIVTVAPDSTEIVTFSVTGEEIGSYTVAVDGLSDSFTVVPPEPAAFTVSALTISPTEIETGDTVTISVVVTNTGDLSGSYEATLKIDNVVVATKDVTVDGGASQTVTFTTSKDVAGTYTVNVNGLSRTFTVEAPPAEPISWWVWLIVGLGVVVIALLAYYLWWRRRFA